ncbi:hypothetical protein T4B_9506 [Trichinella pseudospiralis]|uniref:Uncharacterized protein n=2 Tax=Trichinella pseudospiralis TaxID=6337 RepID=A0A0V1JMY9_TRIPS|nr:hypothetical protein T4D_16400 [Trichinella pseudospiralis]KRZ05427.1 hypothetical protein T4B_9506 [Trichinella pseudospiralis]KRZ36353.1 hypothetical protein T4C_11642 [Trichinella pseudospiralis]
MLTEITRVTSIVGLRCGIKICVALYNMSVPTVPFQTLFSLKIFPEGKHRPFLNVVQCQADPRPNKFRSKFKYEKSKIDYDAMVLSKIMIPLASFPTSYVATMVGAGLAFLLTKLHHQEDSRNH